MRALLLLMACGFTGEPPDISQMFHGGDFSFSVANDLSPSNSASSDLSSSNSASSDLSPSSSASSDLSSSGGLCGGKLCRDSQSCVAGQCQFACSGVTVPGMFPTLASAATSLESTGGTICVGAHTFTSNEAVPYNRALTIIGVSPEQSIFQGRVDLSETTSRTSNTPANLGILGISVEGGMTLELSSTIHDQLRVVASRVHGLVTLSPSASQIVFDGDDLSNDAQNPAMDIVGVFDSAPKPVIYIANCFIHDSGIGIHHLEPTATNPITIVNNTFLNDTTAIIGDGMVASLAVNNLIANSLNAGIEIETAGQSWILHNNSYFMTGNNSESFGPTDVTADPKIDMQTPPALDPFSPCRGAGDSSVAPATDFFARVRGSAVDIGARQEP